MGPVVWGAKKTRGQILLYSLLFVPLAQAPLFTGLGHWAYAAVSAPGGIVFLLLAARLWKSKAGDGGPAGEAGLYDVRAGSKAARNLFAFSILYLFGLFAALLAERLFGLVQGPFS